jgi:hypothetical protein
MPIDGRAFPKLDAKLNLRSMGEIPARSALVYASRLKECGALTDTFQNLWNWVMTEFLRVSRSLEC